MSRALDQDVVASLKKGDPSEAYHVISNVLLAIHADGLLELEILGKTHPLPAGEFVIHDGNAAGVSKAGLIQAFLVARNILSGHIDRTAPRTDDELFAATAVMLLMDPEHLTAANTRKRLLQKKMASNHSNISTIFETEKSLVDSLLTSRLHRHTKSPTLWSHRRWLTQLAASRGVSVDVLADITRIVFVAGERHARNYYAWCHARFLMTLHVGKPLDAILAAVKTWCFSHHTDISGWTFLYFLLDPKFCERAASYAMFDEVLVFVKRLRLTNESVWVILRTMVASNLAGVGAYARLLGTAQELLEISKLPIDQEVIQSATSWCETYRSKDQSATCAAGAVTP